MIDEEDKEVEEAFDYYGQPLKVGDFVIPTSSLTNIKGEIKSIYEDRRYQWLDIYDSADGKIHEGFNSHIYTTQARLNKNTPTPKKGIKKWLSYLKKSK